MPWWVALGFGAYATHMLWQTVSVARERHWHAWFLLPFLVMKVGLLAVATSYWFPEACAMFLQYNWRWLHIPAFFALVEASVMRRLIIEDYDRLKKHPYFDEMMVAQVMASVVLPIALLVIAYLMLGSKQCAAA